MTDALTAVGRMMSRDVEQLRTISQNVANSSTPGYRAVSGAPDAAAGAAPAGQGGQAQVSQRPGTLMPTGRGLDLAITGDGFFAVSTAQGVRYTRDGQFQLKPDGSLVTAGGDPVLGTDGPLVLPDEAVAIGTDGSIRHGNDVVGRLQVMGFRDAAHMRPAGGNLYAADGAQPAADFQVHQGSLEGSNVEVGAELVNIIGLTRHLEGVQRGVMAYDQMLGTGISEIGKPRS